ncbi:MAG: type II secretion system ATPase GspE [Gammaproteobacteria bacterium]
MEPLIEQKSTEPYAAFVEVLLGQEKLRTNDLTKAKRLQKSTASAGLPNILVKLGLCSERDVAAALAQAHRIELVDSDDYPRQTPLPDKISLRFLKEYHVAGLADLGDEMVIAVMDPEDDFVVEALELALGKRISVKIGVMSEIDSALELQYGEGKSQMDQLIDYLDADEAGEEDIEHLKDLASEAPVIKMVNLIMQRAIQTHASDIHIEPFEQSLKVRLRIDGVLQDIDAPPVKSTAAVISRIKIMAKLNIAERRLPQDGRIKLQMMGKELDLRISTIPTMYGESVVIRLLDKESTALDFSILGFESANSKKFIETLSKPNGIILITGPTGSGKSTTLYTALKQLNTEERKIITVEDPIEYQLDGVNQIQAKPQIGLTFANALRSIVRQDPDVIMIGEMRDLETAKIAVQSALTGHLVLSTLHTNDAAGGVTRLLDMGLEDYLLTSTVNGILAQRLVRRLCSRCREPYAALPEVIEEFGLRNYSAEKEIVLYRPGGCEQCDGIGYSGRLAILEFLLMTDAIRKLIMAHEESGKLNQLAIEEGMLSMRKDGVAKAVQGITTLEEVIRVTTES